MADDGINNYSNTPLANGETFTGLADDVYNYSAVTVAVKTDKSGLLYMELSPDGTNWDSSLVFDISANLNEIHRLSVTRRYFRVRFTNDSGEDQTFLRLQTVYGQQSPITSQLNSMVQLDADALIVRSVPAEIDIAAGRFQGYEIVNKFGKTNASNAGNDVWGGSGAYTGFPAAAEEFQIVRSSASDTGSVTFQYLEDENDTEWKSATVALTGATTNTGITGFRAHTMRYESGSPTAFNVGTLTLRHATTTTNVFLIMAIGTSQTNSAGYRIPAGKTGYMVKLTGRILGNNVNQYLDASVWVRTNGGSPRLRRPFVLTQGDGLQDIIYGGLVLPEKTDVHIRITNSSSNSLEVGSGYDIILVDN